MKRNKSAISSIPTSRGGNTARKKILSTKILPQKMLPPNGSGWMEHLHANRIHDKTHVSDIHLQPVKIFGFISTRLSVYKLTSYNCNIMNSAPSLYCYTVYNKSQHSLFVSDTILHRYYVM